MASADGSFDYAQDDETGVVVEAVGVLVASADGSFGYAQDDGRSMLGAIGFVICDPWSVIRARWTPGGEGVVTAIGEWILRLRSG